MKNVGIIYNARIPEALDLGTAILHQLPLSEDSWIAPAENLETLRERAEETGLVITVGGDGTILRAVQVTAPASIPLVGINMGRLGFMTELQVHEALDKLPIYLDGGCRVEERNMLQARVIRSENGANSKKDGPFHALNDVVLARGAASRIVTVTGYVDGAQLTTFRADAVILSTATGSTGYNLAVGGPILDPVSDSLVLKPVAAHMGLTAALVLAPSAEVSLSLEGYQEAILSVDGVVDYPLVPGDRVQLNQSPYRARFLRASPANHFYGTLTRRLGFSIRGQ
jgi:NAD+ kinase